MRVTSESYLCCRFDEGTSCHVTNDLLQTSKPFVYSLARKGALAR